jgi:hypothetical protein
MEVRSSSTLFTQPKSTATPNTIAIKAVMIGSDNTVLRTRVSRFEIML